MFKKKRIILALILIFLCGGITGAAVAPVIIHAVVGNPYSKSALADRVFNTRFLDKLDLSDAQKNTLNDMVEGYVDKYRNVRNNFISSRNDLYNEFITALEGVLTPEQYENYRTNADRYFKERQAYHDKFERGTKDEKWHEDKRRSRE